MKAHTRVEELWKSINMGNSGDSYHYNIETTQRETGSHVSTTNRWLVQGGMPVLLERHILHRLFAQQDFPFPGFTHKSDITR